MHVFFGHTASVSTVASTKIHRRQNFVGKYISHQLCFRPPHVIAFLNGEPKKYNDNGRKTLSMDRGDIVKLPDDINNVLRTQAKVDSKKPPPPSELTEEAQGT